jgi:hypothetical protein
MYLVRNIFHAKPGKAKELVSRFKEASRFMQSEGVVRTRIMTDAVAGFWTVVSEMEIPNLATLDRFSSGTNSNPEIRDAMKDYMTLVEGGHREIFKIEE